MRSKSLSRPHSAHLHLAVRAGVVPLLLAPEQGVPPRLAGGVRHEQQPQGLPTVAPVRRVAEQLAGQPAAPGHHARPVLAHCLEDPVDDVGVPVGVGALECDAQVAGTGHLAQRGPPGQGHPHPERGQPVAEPAVDRRLRGPQRRHRLAAGLVDGREVVLGHRPQQAAASVLGMDADPCQAGGRDLAAGDRQVQAEDRVDAGQLAVQLGADRAVPLVAEQCRLGFDVRVVEGERPLVQLEEVVPAVLAERHQAQAVQWLLGWHGRHRRTGGCP
jgi:hypothetical protein